MRPFRRLYVISDSNGCRFAVCASREEATQVLGPESRTPDADELRIFWATSGIAKMTSEERVKHYGVSRQTIANWRNKGGTDLRTRAQQIRYEERTKLQDMLKTVGKLTSKEMERITGITRWRLHKHAAEMGASYERVNHLRDHEKLLQLCKGRTWRQFAKAVGVTLSTLRQYIYKQPELAEKIRETRLQAPLPKQDRRDYSHLLPKIRSMGHKGLTAYKISELLGIEMMTVRYHLKKMGKERPNDFYAPYGHKRKTGESVDGGSRGVTDRQ